MNKTIVGVASAAVAAILISGVPALAQTMPTIDGDGQLGSATVGDGKLHGVIDVNLQNGDFSRGKYDDDAANLDRLPVAVGLTLGWQLHEDAKGTPDLWIEASSSNGFHSPIAAEHTSPRAWYDNNNVLALFYKPSKGVTTALAYVIKTSPNGVSPTSNELTAAVAYQADTGIGWLHPSTAISVHTKGGSGAYTLFGVEPSFDLGAKDDAPTLSIPTRFGVGWDDFYGAGTGTAAYGSIGLAYGHPFTIGSTHWKARAQILALVRDKTVRQQGAADAEHATVVPLATLGISLAY